MKKTTPRILMISGLIVTYALSLAFTSIKANNYIEVNADYTPKYIIDESDHFEATDNDQVYVCYKAYVYNSQTEKNDLAGVAVKWEKSLVENVTSITVPDSVSLTITINNTQEEDEGEGEGEGEVTTPTTQTTNYDVVAVAKGGFSFSNFSTILLPNSLDEIREEAFAYCRNLTSFTFPYQINQIAPSTFLDCRNLSMLYYWDENKSRSLDNFSVSSIGDHAFESCVSLTSFICPEGVTFFGRSCFQRCEGLTSFIFPADNGKTGSLRNMITIKEYAFADCKRLESVYFEENIESIGEYAFADCSGSLVFQFPGNQNTLNSLLGTYGLWNRKYIASGNITDIAKNYNPRLDYYTVKVSSDRVRKGKNGLRYTLSKKAILLDSAGNDATASTTVTLQATSSTFYAVITDFFLPASWVKDFYVSVDDIDNSGVVGDYPGEPSSDTGNGAFKLIIPTTIENYPVKVIGNNAFNNLEVRANLKEVYFTENLIQIQHGAFLGCSNLEVIDFSDATHLKEISYDIFNEPKPDRTTETYNKHIHSIYLPSSLEYIGEFAFYNFIKLDTEISFGANPHILVIGAYAFATNFRIGETPDNEDRSTNVGIDLVLPQTLSDAAALAANYIHLHNRIDGESTEIEYESGRGYAVGTHAFDNLITLQTVTMEKPTGNNVGKTVSFASHAFCRCSNLVSFKSTNNLLVIGNKMFRDCINLKEIFLYKQDDSTYPSDISCPWGVYDKNKTYSSIFDSDTVLSEDVVIYVSGEDAPKSCNTVTGVYRWNSTGAGKRKSFVNELDTTNCNRSIVQTYYSVNWEKSGSWSGTVNNQILYWKPSDSTFLSTAPYTIDDYNQGIIAIVKDVNETSNPNSVVARYYYKGADRVLKQCTTAITTPEVYTEAHWSNIPDWVSSTYAKGSVVNYEGTIYQAKNAITTPETKFTASNWTAITPTAYSSSSTYEVGNVIAKYSNYLETIDLTDSTLAAACSIYKIGDEAFASENDEITGCLGIYFVLPDTVREIGERAFYRIVNSVRIVTYKSNNNIVTPTGTSLGSSTLPTFYSSNGGFCCLPPNADNSKKIYRNAFYNNLFRVVEIGSGLSFLGNSAFYVHQAYGNDRPGIDSVSFSGVSAFSNISNGIYYSDSGNQILLYQPPFAKNNPCVASLTTDTALNAQKTYYAKSVSPIAENIGVGGYLIDINGYQYTPIDDGDLDVNNIGTYYEVSNCGSPNVDPCVAVKTTDTAIDSEKDYYTKSADPIAANVGIGGNLIDINGYKYTKVTSPNVNNISNYYEIIREGSSGSSLVIASGTTAIGFRAMSHSNYSSVNLPSGLTSIFGGAFQNSTNLKTVEGDGLSSLEYISADSGIYSSTMANYFDISDKGADISLSQYGSAFSGCSSLKTLNFKSMTSIKKIGNNAFYNCSSLIDMAGGDSYTITPYSITNHVGSLGTSTTYTTGILDLTRCSSLTTIGDSAFTGCSKISYVIFPKTAEPTEESTLIVKDAKFHNNTKRFISERLAQAHPTNGNASLHPSAHYARDDTRTYYYTEDGRDLTILADKWVNGVHFWTKSGNNYITFNSYQEAYYYFFGEEAPETPPENYLPS